MTYPPVFLRLRGIAFREFISLSTESLLHFRLAVCITIISVIWIILLCLIVFWRWDQLDTPARQSLNMSNPQILTPTSITGAMFLLLLFTNIITAIMLPLLYATSPLWQ